MVKSKKVDGSLEVGRKKSFSSKLRRILLNDVDKPQAVFKLLALSCGKLNLEIF